MRAILNSALTAIGRRTGPSGDWERHQQRFLEELHVVETIVSAAATIDYQLEKPNRGLRLLDISKDMDKVIAVYQRTLPDLYDIGASNGGGKPLPSLLNTTSLNSLAESTYLPSRMWGN